jgi:hypothetical protein
VQDKASPVYLPVTLIHSYFAALSTEERKEPVFAFVIYLLLIYFIYRPFPVLAVLFVADSKLSCIDHLDQ